MLKPNKWKSFKKSGNKITMVTCYDYSFARILNDTDIDAILIGDSSEMVIFGAKDTLNSSTEKLCTLTQAVRLGAPEKFIVCDLPFGFMQQSKNKFFSSLKKIMASGANAVKVEGVFTYEDRLLQMAAMGIPVMGHLGLTPQHIHQYGGFKVQGKTESSKNLILTSAQKLQELGAFAIVLECIPSSLASSISESLDVPTIGIGAGLDADGQILVLQDLLGMNPDFKPKFVRNYLKGYELIQAAINQYVKDVQNKKFPSIEEAYEL